MRFTKRFTKLVLFSLFTTAFFSGCRSEENQDTFGNLYDEMKIPVESLVDSLYSVKPLGGAVSGSVLLALYSEELQSFRFAYADSSLKNLEYIGNELQTMTDYRNLVNQPKAEFGIGHRPIYDFDENGSLYLLEFRIDRENQPKMTDMFFSIYDGVGNFIERFPVKGASSLQSFVPFKMEINKDKIILVGANGVQILDGHGNLLSEVSLGSTKALNVDRGEEIVLPSGMIVDADWMGQDTFAIVQENGSSSTLSGYNVELKQTEWSTVLPEGFYIRNVVYDPNSRVLYVGSINRILSYDAKGNYIEETIAFDSYESGFYTASFLQGKESLELVSFFLTENEGMTTFLRTTQPPQIISRGYSYQKLTGVKRTEKIAAMKEEERKRKALHVLAPFPDNAIEQKVALFEKQYPDVKVQLSFFKESDQDFNMEDYKQFISLQLFTGKKKWDLMATQFLPYKNYLDKGLFSDVVTAAPTIWAKEKPFYLPNIVKAITQDNKISIIPARISMFVTMADRKAAETLSPTKYKWSDLIRLGKEFKSINPAVKLWYMGTKQKDSFVSRYERAIDAFSQDMLTIRQEELENLISQFLDVIKETGKEINYADPPQEKPLFIMDYFFMNNFLNNLDLYINDKVLLGEPAMEKSGGHAFLIQEGYAVNKSSDWKQEAFELAFFLSRYAEPNNIIRQDTYDHLLKTDGITPEGAEVITQLRKITESLDTLNYIDHRVTDAILYTAQQFDSGTIEKEEAVRTIKEKLWLYLHE